MRLIPTLVAVAAAAFAPTALAQNDDCSGALPITVGSTPFNTSGATQSSPTWPCAGGGGPDLWYRYSATSNDLVILDTCGSSFDTAIQAFSGTCSSLNPIVCNDDACGLQSTIQFSTVTGNDYLLRVGGYAGNTGSGTLNLTLIPALNNDECVSAAPITSGVTGFSNIGATTSSPWPCAAGGADIWYVFTAGTGGTVDVDLCGSGYDCCVEVLQGTCGSLSSIICNDDSCGLRSFVSFPVSPGTSYYIRVGGYAGSEGTGTIEISGSGAPGGLGTNYCMALPNSTGLTGVMTAVGSPVAVLNDLTVIGNNLPSGQFAYAIAGRTQGFVPFAGGSQGVMCLLGVMARFNQQLGAITGGVFAVSLDLTSFPEPPTMNHQVVAGETWNFQVWHRDVVAGAPTSNFTDGLTIDFQ